MAVRVRRSVYSLSPTGPELIWYGRAIDALSQTPVSQRGSWRYIAACHGISNQTQTPANAQGLWRQCQHQTWFFLSWHRAYLTGFEAIIAAKVKAFGGPSDWALPYWDYSNSGNPNARQLPPAFRRQTNANGTRNWLWSPRNAPVAPQTVLTLPSGDVGLGALNQSFFSAPGSSAQVGFGGPQTGFSHFGNRNGEVERLPHNRVHVSIGGLMLNPDTAALDPIFWLHHCNIDRLWEAWRRARGPAVADPTQVQWRTGVTFDILTDKAANWKFKSVQSLDTTTLLHGYRYDTVQPVKPIQAGGTPMAAKKPRSKAMITADERSPQPELIAASGTNLKLGAKKVHADVRPTAASSRFSVRAAAEGQAREPRYILLIENVKAEGPGRDYRVFIDLPDGDKMPSEVGTLATFGVGGATDASSAHGNNGLTQAFDITDELISLGIGSGQLGLVRVTFEPLREGKLESVPPDFPYKDLLPKEAADLSIGRISIYEE